MEIALDESLLMLKNLFQLPEQAGVKWEKFREGIDIHRLYDTAGGPSAALLRYRAGAALQRHVHVGYEHILVLRGSQIDDAGEHVAGTLLVYQPGQFAHGAKPERLRRADHLGTPRGVRQIGKPGGIKL